MSLRKKVEESVRREEELRQHNLDLRRSQDILKAETDGLNALSSSEKMELQKLREELRELSLDMRKRKEDLQVTTQELIANQGHVEALKTQRMQLEDMRTEIMSEIHRLRETSKAEAKRAERMEQTCGAVEDRLKSLKIDISRTEASYEKVRLTWVYHYFVIRFDSFSGSQSDSRRGTASG